ENDKSIKVPGNFHCLITEHGLDPGVLIFVRGVKGQLPKSDAEAEKKKGTDEKDDMLGVEAGKLLKELVARLETVAAKNPAVPLETYVIFHGDKPLKDVVRMDDEREHLAEELEALAKELRGMATDLRKPEDVKMPADTELKSVVLALASPSLPQE